MRLFFFPFFEFPREYPRDCPGGTSTQPQPRVRVRTQGNAIEPPKTQVSFVRMRPREFLAYHKDETSSSSTHIRALRVRVRVTGL